MSNLLIFTNTFILPHVTFNIVRKVFFIVKHYAFIEFVPKIIFLDVHCNSLGKWLTERWYSEKLVCEEILEARALTRETLLDKEKC